MSRAIRIPSWRERSRELARRSLWHFVRFCAWPALEPGKRLVEAWYMRAICDHLEAVARGEIKRLIVNIPPRHGKSTLISSSFLPWVWIHRPEARIFTASYDLDLATRDARASKKVINDSTDMGPEDDLIREAEADGRMILRYRELGPGGGPHGWTLTTDTDEFYVNTRTGERRIAAPRAGTLGHGGDFLLIDDPHDARKIHSDAERLNTLAWFDEAMKSRLNDPKQGAIVLIMQRLHEQDLTGHVRQGGGWEHLCLPTMWEPEHPYANTKARPTKIGFTDPRTTAGELLCEERFGPEEIKDTRKNELVWRGQHQQDPSQAGGNILQREWFRWWGAAEHLNLPARFDFIFQSWDCAFKGDGEGRRTLVEEIRRVVERSYVVGQVWGVHGNRFYLLDEERGRWDWLQTKAAARRLSKRWPSAVTKLVEAKANGIALVNELNEEPGLGGWLEVEPKGSKVERAYAVQSLVISGQVFLPAPEVCPWIDAVPADPTDASWIVEITRFPMHDKMDRMDALTQALIHGREMGGLSAYAKLKALGSV